MELEDLGINPKTGVHNPRLTATESLFLAILWDHATSAKKISADELAARMFFGTASDFPEDAEGISKAISTFSPAVLAGLKRDVRMLQNHLLMDHENSPVLSQAGAGGGYWMAENEDEARQFFQTFRRRALTGLVKASRGKKSAMVDMMTQLSFEFGDLVDASGVAVPAESVPSGPVAARLVESLLERMLSAPDKFEADLRRLSAKFGTVLFSREQAAEVKAMAVRLNELASAI